MDHNEQRDHAEEAWQRANAEMEDVCTQDHGAWESGMMCVSKWDVQATYEELQAKGIRRDIECEKCGGIFVPGKSFDPYAF